MSKRLAILGHPTRGKEVIELLEMMGGDNIYSHWYGDQENMRYFINEQGNIDNGYLMANCNNYEVFTLEEFWEKYPFKVGDKVVYEDDNDIVVISKIKWDNTIGDIFYSVKKTDEEDCFLCPPELLKPYKKTNMNMNDNKVESTGFMQMGKTCGIIFNEANYEDEVELQLGDYEIEIRDGKTYAVRKKPKYPTTYEECCEVLMGKTNFSEFTLVPIKYSNTTKFDNSVSPDAPYMEIFNNLYTIIICRDAYWKIAGEEMRLDKPWKPDWENGQNKFCIISCENRVTRGVYSFANTILAFPTEEMRDVFYENFKDLIEQCKELL